MCDFIIEDGTMKKYIGTETSVVIPEGVTVIEKDSLPSTITSVTIPNSLKKMRKFALWNVSSLREIHISSIEAWCNVELEILSCPPNGNLYLNGELITHFTVPDGLSFFYTQHVTFDSIDEITIPPSVKKIIVDTSFRCTKLHIRDLSAWCNIELINKSEHYFKCLWVLYLNSKPITNLKIPQGHKTIRRGTFYGCELESVTIPEGVECIEQHAFRYCNHLKTAHLPSTIRTIQDYAFASDFCMTELTFLRDSGVFISESAFMNCDTLPDTWPISKNNHHRLWTICPCEDATKILESDEPVYLRPEYYNQSDYDRISQEADDWRIVGSTESFGCDGYTGASFKDSNSIECKIQSEHFVLKDSHLVGIFKYSNYNRVTSKAIDIIYIKDWNGTPIPFSKEEYVYEDGLLESGSSCDMYFTRKEN